MTRKHRSRRRSSSIRRTPVPCTRLALEGLEDRRLLTAVSGILSSDAVWDLAGSPYDVTGTVTVASGAQLEIEPGVVVRFQDDTGLEVEGRLVADGAARDRITFEPAPAASQWNGLVLENTLADNRIAYADMRGGDALGQVIRVDNARLGLANITWADTQGTILELNHPSLIVRNSHFPSATTGPVIHGQSLENGEHLIIQGNLFDNNPTSQDVIAFTGAQRPGPIVQVLDNAFLGGGDDGVDLQGADAHLEGNLFVGFHQDAANATTSNAIAARLAPAGGTESTELTVVRNIFLDSDHGVLLAEQSFAQLENNIFVGMTGSVMQFNETVGTEVDSPGLGARLDGNILFGNAALFEGLVNDAGFQTALSVYRSILPNEVVHFGSLAVNAHDLGTGNSDLDPMFVDPSAGNYRLQESSPAIGQGPNGLDIGAYVPAGPVVTGIPTEVSDGDNLVFHVGGPGITHYRYRMNDGAYGPVTPVSVPIELTGLANGDQTVDVIGRNDAGEWFAGQTPAFRENRAEIIVPTRTRAGEMLPIVVRVRDAHDQINSLLSDLAVLNNGADLAATGFEIKKGVGSLSPIVDASGDFSLQMAGDLADSPTRDIVVLDATFPVQTYGGTLSGNTVWDNTVERRITSDLSIPSGSSLTIQPGTRILLGDKVNIDVNGTITASGTQLDPIVFNSIDRLQPWGGIELGGAAIGTFDYAFFTNAAADTSRQFGHSDSQPVIMVDGGLLNFTNGFILNTIGKAFGADAAELNIDRSVISETDTGAQFDSSLVKVTRTYVKDLPRYGSTFLDDDNDGLYFHGYHSSGQPSLLQDSFILGTQDDGVDHNGARLNIVRTWIEKTAHEGVASSSSNYANIVDSVFTRSNQGLEAGYGSPNLTVSHSVMFNADNRSDPDSSARITTGLRFGDGYETRGYHGHITAENNVIHDNGDNIRNYDGTIPGPQPGAIDITYSMTNDADYNSDLGNFTGVPLFGPFMHLLRGSDGLGAGSDGENVGRLLPPVQNTFRVSHPDFTPPSAPQNLQGQTTGAAQVTLSWDPAVDPDSGIDFFTIYRDGQQIGSGPDTGFVDNQVAPGTVYLYTVTATNGVGMEGPAATQPVAVSTLQRFQDGVFPDASYAGTTDVRIRGGGEADTPLGLQDRLDADGSDGGASEWSLIRWDVRSLASDVDVENVTLTFTLNNPSDDDYAIYGVTRSWVESEATYNQSAVGQAWETPGTGATDRGVLVGVLSSQNQTGARNVVLNSDGVDLVQSWINDPATNFGVILYSPSSSDGVEIRSREYTNAQQRPQLTIALDDSSPGLVGDYNRNGTVESVDHALWKATYGSTTSLYADGNGNGIVDTADFTVWRDHRGDTLAPSSEVATSLGGEIVADRSESTVSTAALPTATLETPAPRRLRDTARARHLAHDRVFEQMSVGPIRPLLHAVGMTGNAFDRFRHHSRLATDGAAR